MTTIIMLPIPIDCDADCLAGMPLWFVVVLWVVIGLCFAALLWLIIRLVLDR